MYQVFGSFLIRLILVFFNDVLIYSQSLEDHLKHLQVVLKLLRDNKLYAKMSKCDFSLSQVEYLGHIISSDGVSTEPRKIEAMVNWPQSANLKELREFLGLIRYYRRFIKN